MALWTCSCILLKHIQNILCVVCIILSDENSRTIKNIPEYEVIFCFNTKFKSSVSNNSFFGKGAGEVHLKTLERLEFPTQYY